MARVLVTDALVTDQPELLALARELVSFERTLRASRRGGLLPASIVDGWLRELDVHEGRILIARLDGRAVGFLRCVVRDDDLETATTELHVSELYVRDAVRGAGVGRALLEAAEEAARRAGAARLTLDALAANEAAGRSYEALGFEAAYVTYARDLRA